MEAIAALRQVADDGRGDRRGVWRWRSRRFRRCLSADRAGQALAARAARAAEPLRAPAARRAAAHRRQEARAGSRRRRATRDRQPPSQAHRPSTAANAGSPGWEFVHVCVDDATRLAYVEVLADETGAAPPSASCAARSRSTRRHGISVERVMTDNGSGYRSTVHALACRELGHAPPTHPALPAAHQRQSRTFHPHPARRLGIRRDLRLAAENAPPPLTAGSAHYNYHRPHGSLSHKTPAARLTELNNNRAGR